MPSTRESDLRELVRLERERTALMKRIVAVRTRLAKDQVPETRTETTIARVLRRWGPLSFSEIVERTRRNRNTIKTALRQMRKGSRIVHFDRKYPVSR